MTRRTRFPDPRRAPADAPLARGGDLQPQTLLDAYSQGIFPWPLGNGRLLWWSPDPRAVFALDGRPGTGPEGVHVSRTLRRSLRARAWRCTVDGDFAAVIRACAQRPGEGTWITEGMIAAYMRLHDLGVAHSLEVRDAEGSLVGGIYGVALGAAFMGESMFSRVTDASKVALVTLAGVLREGGFALLDAQVPTAHLTSMGALALPRTVFLDELARAVGRPAALPRGPVAQRWSDPMA